MDIQTQIADKIVKEQEAIIGPVALEQARKVSGLTIDDSENIKLEGDKKLILENLIKQYEKLFGLTSIEVCKEAVHEVKDKIPQEDLPDILK